MQILKAFKQKLILTSEQTQKCENYAGQNRLVYNTALDQRNMTYSLYKKSIFYHDQAAELKELKEAFPFLKEAPAQTFQQSLKDQQTAFDRFFKGIAGYPSFRRKFVNDSFRFPEPKEFRITRLSKRKGTINLPKLGVCKFWWPKKLEGKPRSTTITKEAGIWYISILCLVTIPDPWQVTPENAKTATALDRGCNNLIGLPRPGLYKDLTSQANHLFEIVDTPEIFDPFFGHLVSLRDDVINKYETKIIRYQKILALKKKGSRVYKNIKTKISKFHRRLRNYRQDVLHQLSTMIVENQDIIFLEALDVQKMTRSNKGTLENPGTDVKKKSRLNKNILQQGWGYLRIFLKYKSKWRGKLFHDDVPAYYTSQKCYKCKYIDEKNRNGDEFLCLRCGNEDHSDVNAAKNILRAGLSQIASAPDQLRLLKCLGTSLLSSTA